MGNVTDARKPQLLTDDETDRLYNQLVAGEPIPGMSFGLMIIVRAFPKNPGFWKLLSRCIAASGSGDRAAKRIMTGFNDLGDRYFTDLVTDEGIADEKGLRRRIKSWGNEWVECAERLGTWHARRAAVGAKPTAFTLAPEPLPETLVFSNNMIHSAVVSAFSTAPQWAVTPIDQFSRGAFRQFDHMGLGVVIGMRQSGQSLLHWENLRRSGHRMVKAHYALCAHWQEKGTSGHEPIRIDINQFCQDLGYEKHHNGGYRRRDKQGAIKTLETLIAIELEASFMPSGGPQRRLRGPVWNLGLIAEERKQHGGHRGLEAAGDEAAWEPVGFSYSPGDWFQDECWRAYTRRIGRIGAGLLNLDNQNDQGAILIGGYIGTLSWPGRTKIRLRVSTILKRTGLFQGAESYRRASETRASFERSLMCLQENFVVTGYSGLDESVSDLSDPDDPDELTAYFSESPDPPNKWRKQVLEFEIDIEKNAAALRAFRLTHAEK